MVDLKFKENIFIRNKKDTERMAIENKGTGWSYVATSFRPLLGLPLTHSRAQPEARG